MIEAELLELEGLAADALHNRDDSKLNILGYGEVSVALGWPVADPKFVCKRTPPGTKAELSDYEHLVTEYISRVETAGLPVVETTMVTLHRDDGAIGYLVQPLLDESTLGHNVLRSATPDPDHPFLVALAQSLRVVSPTLSIDAQVTNFAWDGSALTLVDVGTPFMWDEHGRLRLEIKPFAQMLPAPTRPIAIRELTKLVTRWNEPRRVGIDIVANLYREGLPEWVDPVVIALNRVLPSGDSITADEAKEFFEEDKKIWPLLKRLQTVERWWRTTVRRQPYDFFIYSSFE